MALTTIEYGALASSEVMNNNFEYLDNRISSVSETFNSNNAGIYSNIASINTLIIQTSNKLRPVGQPIIRLDNTIYEDEIRLEGAEVSRTTYSALFQIYGITYGAGDGVNTFNLPDFRERVLWGGESFGYLDESLPNITGQFYAEDQSAGGNTSGAFTGTKIKSGVHSGDGGASRNMYAFDASNSSEIYANGASVRPSAIKIRVVTRYK